MKNLIDAMVAEMKSIVGKVQAGTSTESERITLAILTKFLQDLTSANNIYGNILPVS